VLLVACGGSDGDPYGRTLGPEPATCASSWKRIYAPDQMRFDGVPQALAWHDGRVYYGAPFQHEIAIVSEDGTTRVDGSGIPITFHPLWFDGDRVSYITAASVPGTPQAFDHWELRTLPATGGALLGTTAFAFSNKQPDLLVYFDVTPDAIFAAREVLPNGVGISRFDRVTGAEQAFPDVTLPDTLYIPTGRLQVVGDWVFAAQRSHPFAVPITGGAPVFAQPAPGNQFGPAGVSRSGEILWNGSRSNGTKTDHFVAIGQVGSADPPRELDADLPRDAIVALAWDDGAGGWWLAGYETLADGAIHVMVWRMDAAGKARLAACDPEAGRAVELGAVSPAGVFLAVSFQRIDFYTEIAFVRP
jgi:hypothetical protein